MKPIVLHVGDRGQVVQAMQRALIRDGYLPLGAADGIFGPGTETAVRGLQLREGLVVDGIAGKDTLQALHCSPIPALDLSKWQGKVNWQAIAAAGIQRAWAKATEGASHIDPTWSQHVQDTRDLLPLGGYHFALPNRHLAQAEADWFLRAWDDTQGALGAGAEPALDLESLSATAGMSVEQLLDWTGTWLTRVRVGTGQMPDLYTTIGFLHQQLGGAKGLPGLCRLWLAAPRPDGAVDPQADLAAFPELHAWQHSWHDRVDGIRGDVDTDWIFV